MTVEELKKLDQKYRDFKVPKGADTITTVKRIYEAITAKALLERAADREAEFVLQRHFTLHRIDNPKIKGKSYHFDVRIRPKGSRTWFGFALKKDPSTLSPTEKTIAPPKGSEYTPKEISNMYWFNVKYDTFPPDFPGNWTKNYVVAIERIDKGRCVIHRRENDFLDVTFYGRKLSGRYYFRRVERPGGEHYWIVWRAKQQDAGVSSLEFSRSLVESAMHQDVDELTYAMQELLTNLKEFHDFSDKEVV